MPVARQPSRNVIVASAASGELCAALATRCLTRASENMTTAVTPRYAIPIGDDSADVPGGDVVDARRDQVDGEHRERDGDEPQRAPRSSERVVVGDVPHDHERREHLDERVEAERDQRE